MSTPRLSDRKRKEIEIDLKTKMTHQAIAKKHDVSVGTISNVRKGLVKSPIEQANPTDARILKLEAQNIALRDENARCRQSYKAAQRKNSIFEAVVDEMHQIVIPIKPPRLKSIPVKSKKIIQESLVVMLSDEHADQIVLPEQVGNLERYNFRIALRRAEKYVDTIIKFTKNTLSNYHFHTLYIFAIGDHTSGEIHNAKDHSEYRNAFRNSLAIGQMHSLMLQELSTHFPKIEIIYLSGNHGRRSVKKDYHSARDNWDYLIAETARMYCRDIKSINFVIPDAYSAGVDIEGWGFGLSHGDDIRSWQGIPWYGIERKTRRLAAISATRGKRIHYYCFGHFHNAATQAALDGETIINGSWVATDPYAYESLSVFSEPSQWLFGVHQKQGISWRLNMSLRTDREHLGPCRYSISLAE